MRLDRAYRLKSGQEDGEGEGNSQKEWGEEQTETRKRKDFHVCLWRTSTIHEKGKKIRFLIKKIFYSPCWLKYLQSPEIRQTLWVPLHTQTAITLKAGINTAILLQYYFSHQRIWMLQWGLEGYRWDQEVAHKTILTLGGVSHPVRACVHLWESSPADLTLIPPPDVRVHGQHLVLHDSKLSAPMLYENPHHTRHTISESRVLQGRCNIKN